MCFALVSDLFRSRFRSISGWCKVYLELHLNLFRECFSVSLVWGFLLVDFRIYLHMKFLTDHEKIEKQKKEKAEKRRNREADRPQSGEAKKQRIRRVEKQRSKEA